MRYAKRKPSKGPRKERPRKINKPANKTLSTT